MTHGSVLVVDDKPANVKLLSTRLRLLGYEVLEALTGQQAFRLASEMNPDLVLSDVAMPGMDGLQLTRKLKEDSHTTDIPVVLVTAYSADETRLKGLESGADEFLNKPIRSAELEARVKSLVRLSRLQKELKRRSDLVDSSADFSVQPREQARRVTTLVLASSRGAQARLVDALEIAGHTCIAVNDIERALEVVQEKHPDVILVDLATRQQPVFDFLTALHHRDEAAVIIVTGPPELDLKLEALEHGASDYLSKPVVTRESLARLRTTLQRARATSNQRRRLSTALTEAHTDALTQVYNRRFLFKDLSKRLTEDDDTFSLLMVDIDHFKKINDSLGHATGDKVLCSVANVLERQLRASDFVARYGGEEFVIVLPGTGLREAATIAERLRENVSRESLTDSDSARVTVSVGVASRHGNDRQPEELLKRADRALYDAKSRGRNRVVQAY